MVNKLSPDDALVYGIKFAEKNGAEQIEGYNSQTREIEISVEKSIPTIKTGLSSGLSFRVIAQSNVGFAFTKTLTKSRIEETIKVALQNAKSKGKDPHFKTLPLPTKKTVQKFQYDPALDSITADSMADQITHLIEAINDVKGMHYLQGQMFLGIQNDHLINSNGIDIAEQGGNGWLCCCYYY